jgi:hypothetical protein
MSAIARLVFFEDRLWRMVARTLPHGVVCKPDYWIHSSAHIALTHTGGAR